MLLIDSFLSLLELESTSRCQRCTNRLRATTHCYLVAPSEDSGTEVECLSLSSTFFLVCFLSSQIKRCSHLSLQYSTYICVHPLPNASKPSAMPWYQKPKTPMLKCLISKSLCASHSSSSISSGRYWFLDSQTPQKKILQRQHHKEHLIAEKCNDDNEERDASIQIIVIGSSHNRDENPRRVSNGD